MAKQPKIKGDNPRTLKDPNRISPVQKKFMIEAKDVGVKIDKGVKFETARALVLRGLGYWGPMTDGMHTFYLTLPGNRKVEEWKAPKKRAQRIRK